MNSEKNGISPGRKGPFCVPRSRIVALLFAAIALRPLAPVLYAQTELGSSDDLTVMGTNGTALDPDVEIKGFTVFGSTQSAYPGNIPVLAGNVVVNGYLSVSSGSYFSANSTFTAANTVFINDGSAGQLLAKNSAGYLQWVNSAVGDNLGNHVATTTLQMGNYAITSSTAINAKYYQIAGSTVLAVLDAGRTSLGVGPYAGQSGSATNNTFVGVSAGQVNTGTSNAFMGFQAGWSNVGDSNSFFGETSGEENTSGSWNTFIGNAAGQANTTGGDNLFMGQGPGIYFDGGWENVFLGANAGSAWGNVGNNNVFVGASAGSASTGDDNTFIGMAAGDSSTSGSDNIVIGYNQDTSAENANNEINIGGVYKGDVSAGTATIPKLTVQDEGTNPGTVNLTSADFGKTFISTGATTGATYNLPSVSAADIGAQFTFIKLGAGKVTIHAADSDFISDSTAGGTIYNTAVSPPRASITIILINGTLWEIVSGDGAWITT